MENDEVQFEVITYKDTVVFDYTVPGEETKGQIEKELLIVWDDTIEDFFEKFGKEKPYKLETFKREKERNNLLENIETMNEDMIDDVQEEIANKTKFGFEFSGPLHNDD